MSLSNASSRIARPKQNALTPSEGRERARGTTLRSPRRRTVAASQPARPSSRRMRWAMITAPIPSETTARDAPRQSGAAASRGSVRCSRVHSACCAAAGSHLPRLSSRPAARRTFPDRRLYSCGQCRPDARALSNQRALLSNQPLPRPRTPSRGTSDQRPATSHRYRVPSHRQRASSHDEPANPVTSHQQPEPGHQQAPPGTGTSASRSRLCAPPPALLPRPAAPRRCAPR